jgi:hypothetical protein
MRELFPQFLHFVVLYDSLLLDSSSLASVDDRSIGEDSVTREAALREFINVLNEIIGHQIIETDSYGFGRGGRSKSFELGLEFRDVYAEVARLAPVGWKQWGYPGHIAMLATMNGSPSSKRHSRSA